MIRTRLPRTVLLLWALFLVRVSFYCVMMPLWEGWDEYAHFAWLDHWIDHGTLPRFDDPMAREIEASLRVVPLSKELAWMGPPHLTHEQWWALPEIERAERVKRLRELPPAWAMQDGERGTGFYEAQQPPLYYWTVSSPLRLVSSWNLSHRVLFMRLLSAFIASFAIPLTWLAARRLFGNRESLMAAGLLAAAPGLAIDTFRVANDSLAIALFALTLWLLVRRESTWLQVGAVIGAALLAKAYMLVLIPILIVSWLQRRRDLALALTLALTIGGWWYARNLLLGNSLSGWILHIAPGSVAGGMFAINWISALDIIAKSFTWFGGWSFLTLKSWMYHVLQWAGLVAASVSLYKWRGRLFTPAIACAFYFLAMLYGTLIYNAAQGVPSLPGWYAWPAGGALAILVAGSPWRLSLALICALVLLDLYGVAAVLAPYYAGLTARNHADVSAFIPALHRLNVPVAFAALWVAVTIGIPFVACNRMSAPND